MLPTQRVFLGLPEIAWWGILTGCLIILFLTIALICICFWFLPRRETKIPNSIESNASSIQTSTTTATTAASTRDNGIMSQSKMHY